MLQYPIHLTTIQQFKKYASFTYSFPLTGYVRIEDTQINLSFLQELMCHCPIRQAELILTSYRSEDVSALEAFLSSAGLIDLSRISPTDQNKIA